MSDQTFTSETIDETVTWRLSEEDHETDRWSASIQLSRIKISIEVLVPKTASRPRKLKIVNTAIRNLAERFDSNINKIVRWFEQNCNESHPNTTPKQFERELLKSATLLIDFTSEPTRRELLFWKTCLQHLGVPVSPRGNVP